MRFSGMVELGFVTDYFYASSTQKALSKDRLPRNRKHLILRSAPERRIGYQIKVERLISITRI
jgi:hypothetical protein